MLLWRCWKRKFYKIFGLTKIFPQCGSGSPDPDLNVCVKVKTWEIEFTFDANMWTGSGDPVQQRASG